MAKEKIGRPHEEQRAKQLLDKIARKKAAPDEGITDPLQPPRCDPDPAKVTLIVLLAVSSGAASGARVGARATSGRERSNKT